MGSQYGFVPGELLHHFVSEGYITVVEGKADISRDMDDALIAMDNNSVFIALAAFKRMKAHDSIARWAAQADPLISELEKKLLK